MTLLATLRTLVHRDHRRARLVDELGFAYSRDLDPPTQAVVPDGVELHFITGRTRQEATR